MQKIVEYDVYKAATILELHRAVERGIAGGLQPLGGVCVVPESERRYAEVLQAMVRYEEPDTGKPAN